MKKHWPLLLLAVGVLIFAGSLVYGVFVVGIPGPDDPPAEVARQARHMPFAFWGEVLGLLAIVVGAVAGMARLIRHCIARAGGKP